MCYCWFCWFFLLWMLVLLYILRCSYAGCVCVCVYNQLLYLLLRLITYSLCSLVFSCNSLYFKVFFKVPICALLLQVILISFCMEYIFPYTHCLYVSLDLKGIACRQLICESCFCNHSARLSWLEHLIHLHLQ